MMMKTTDRILMYIVGIFMILLASALVVGRGDALIGFQVLIAWLKLQDWFSVVEQMWLGIRLAFVTLLFVIGGLLALVAAFDPDDTEEVKK